MLQYIEIPIDFASQPSTGHVWVDRYWLVRDDCVLFYSSLTSPQCNSNKLIMERFIENKENGDEYKVVKIKTIYKSSCGKFTRIEQKLKS